MFLSGQDFVRSVKKLKKFLEFPPGLGF